MVGLREVKKDKIERLKRIRWREAEKDKIEKG
jgi:hypothetical protein